jgi:hypothetical protein
LLRQQINAPRPDLHAERLAGAFTDRAAAIRQQQERRA